MILHRAVDKYNLVFVYDTEIADKSVHRLAGNFIIIALLIQQLTLLFFVLVRSGLSTNEREIFFSNICLLETLNYLSMTLLGSFIITCKKICFLWSVVRWRIFDLGGIYFGFSFFDCCGRWSSRRASLIKAMLPEVSTTLLPSTLKTRLLNKMQSFVRNLVIHRNICVFFSCFLRLKFILLENYRLKIHRNFFQAPSTRQKLDDIGETEEVEGREAKQRATSVRTSTKILSFNSSCFLELHSNDFKCLHRRIRSRSQCNESTS